jgi:hypothetical protein
MRKISMTALAVAGAAVSIQSASAADDQRHVDGAADTVSLCVAEAAHAARPELQYDLSVSPPQTVAAKQYQSDEDNIWLAEFHDAAGGTDVVLRQGTGSTSVLDAVWKIVERCG